MRHHQTAAATINTKASPPPPAPAMIPIGLSLELSSLVAGAAGGGPAGDAVAGGGLAAAGGGDASTAGEGGGGLAAGGGDATTTGESGGEGGGGGVAGGDTGCGDEGGALFTMVETTASCTLRPETPVAASTVLMVLVSTPATVEAVVATNAASAADAPESAAATDATIDTSASTSVTGVCTSLMVMSASRRRRYEAAAVDISAGKVAAPTCDLMAAVLALTVVVTIPGPVIGYASAKVV